MEPDHANETPIHDFTVPVLIGAVCVSTGGLDNLGQKLLAERGETERASPYDRFTE
jgi:hypothetical protein